MKKTFLLFCLLIAANYSFSQTETPAFGKADMNELLMKECEFEKSAGAMKLLDYQETEIIIDYDYKIRTERRVRIKVFDRTGFDAAKIIIPYVGRNKSAKIVDIVAYIYSLDESGKPVTQKIEKKQIFRDKSEEGISKVSFTFPNLKPGSVVEYRYTKKEKNSIHLEPWFFQDKIPTLLSSCKLIIPSRVNYEKRLIVTDSIESDFRAERLYNTSYSPLFNIYNYTMRRVASFSVETMMTSVKDNLQRIEFAIAPLTHFTSLLFSGNDKWSLYVLALQFAPFFGQQFSVNITDANPILDTARQKPTLDQKVEYIYTQVKKNLEWDGNQSFYADNLDETWKKKTANSAEINLTLLNLLRKAGIKCHPILISTRDNGKPDQKFFSLGQFNGVDVLVVDSTGLYLLDGTQKYQSYKTPPLNILNRDVLVADTGMKNDIWVRIIDNRQLMKNTVSVNASMKDNGEIKGNIYEMCYDYAKALTLNYKPEKEDEEDEFIQKDNPDFKIDSSKMSNAEDNAEPLIRQSNFTYNLSKTDNFYFLDPYFTSLFRKNPFTDSIRKTDIDFGSKQYYSTAVYIKIPENIDIEHLPVSRLLRAEDSSMIFKRIILFQDKTLVIRNSFELERAVFAKEEYPALRDFFNKVYALATEQILLIKK